MSWLLSLQVSFCCQAHFAIYNSESTSFLLVVEQCCTSFWNLWKPILWVDQQIMISTYLFSSLSGERNWEKTGYCRTKQSMHCKNVLPIWYWHRQHKWIWRLMKFQLQVVSVTQVCLSISFAFKVFFFWQQPSRGVVLEVCRNLQGRHLCVGMWSQQSRKLALNEIMLWHGCPPVGLLRIFGVQFGGVLLFVFFLFIYYFFALV